LIRSGAQGDTKAARQVLELISRAETARSGTAVEILQFVAQYKETYTPIFDKHEREGLDPPDIYPHPDDFIINNATGKVTIDGPISKGQAGAQKAVRQQALETMGRYFELEAALAKDPTNHELRREFNELKKYQDFLKQDSERVLRRKATREARLLAQNHPNQTTTPRIKRDG
jgi:hypothetical protein